MHKLTQPKSLFFIFVLLLGVIAQKLPIVSILGGQGRFSFFHCVAPVATGLFQTGPGLILLFLIQILSMVISKVTLSSVGLLFQAKVFVLPTLAAALSFSKHGRKTVFVPLACALLFVAHPVGREAWAYTLLWSIPLICHYWRDHALYARSLEATFAAHAVGSVIWLYMFQIGAEAWMGLIPIVLAERALFAGGMSLTYLALKNVSLYLANGHANKLRA